MSGLIKTANKDKLHEKLGIKDDKKIPVAALNKAAKSKSPALAKEAQFAINARTWKK